MDMPLPLSHLHLVVLLMLYLHTLVTAKKGQAASISSISTTSFHLVQPLEQEQISSSHLRKIVEEYEPMLIKCNFPAESERWPAEMLKNLHNEQIEYDARDSKTGKIDSYTCRFHQFINSVPDNSDHGDSMYFMSEEVLLKTPELASQIRLNPEIFEENLFDLFPEAIRPKDALIIGGVGARSFLHKDPYDWTGWNHLFEGKKLCTF
jgi:hypothetical protein